MKITSEIIHHFCKSFGINFPIKEEKYFFYYIDLYDGVYQTKEKWNVYKAALNLFNDENEFMFYLRNIVDSIIESIQKKQEYVHFKEDSTVFDNKLTYKVSKNTPYNFNNVNEWFLSIDLAKANFQALNFYDKGILNADTYEAFIKSVLSSEKEEIVNFVIASKKYRQIIFGNLSPKKTTHLETKMIQEIFDYIKEHLINYDDCLSCVSIMHDELIFKINTKHIDIAQLKQQIDAITDTLPYCVHTEIYQLCTVIDRKKWFLKKFDNNKKKLLCVPANFIPQAIRIINNEEIQETDRYIIFEGEEAILKPITE